VVTCLNFINDLKRKVIISGKGDIPVSLRCICCQRSEKGRNYVR